ncbi:endolytic transglycosylase MltG [Candidatus Solirubrobacter pratensis]|uniref:endolytic transglycosylase MltG n=1 Tax=Candidatus Solirubrobacter pratensis TaxID=1298857 RepID=UPI0003F50F6C|nr:endolytic transglycosylase MltG [Candidatus Solirubrobacter pratensis]
MFGKRSDETRTAEDRAHAAAERAARRAGRPLPPEAFEDAVRPPDLQDFRRPEAAPEPPPPPPPPPAVDPVEQHTVEYTPFQTGEHSVPEPVEARVMPEPAGSEPRVRRIPRTDRPAQPVEPEAPAPEPTPEHDLEPVEPAPPIAVTDRPPLPPRRRPAPATPRKRPTTPPPGAPRRSRGSYWGRRLFGVVAVIVILLVLYAVDKTFQPFHSASTSRPVAVSIPQNSSVGEIGTLLEAKGVIGSARFFGVNATVTGRRGDLHPGRYTLYRDMSNGAVLDQLTKGPKGAKAAPTFKVTIPEGPSRKEMAARIDKSEVGGSYLKASAAGSVLTRIRKLGAPKRTKTAEGFLFPATYTFTAGATAKDLVGDQLAAFADNFANVDMSYAKSKHLSRYDVLIIASMIEREAQLPRERALVSAVIYNRLKQGMPLGIDATIRYYTNNWTRPIRQSELQADEPYNTRLNRGLPPTPIGNPGLASLKAAAKPAKKSYLFYVRKPGNSGEHAFSSTDAQFERDVQKYQDSRKGK